MSGVYYIFCDENKKGYVGSSENISARWVTHKSNLTHNKHKNKHLQNAYNKYGKSNFKFSILFKCPKEYNTKLEQWVKDNPNINTDFNIRIKCENNYGIKMSEEVKEKIRIKATGRNHTDETKKILSVLKLEKIKNDIVYREKLLANIIRNPKGESNPNSKLSEADVISIRTQLKNGKKVKDLVGQYNCSQNMLYEIKNGHNWKHISA